MNELLQNLKKEFEISININPKTYLGMEITRTENRLFISQPNYAKQILER